jgi:hypothetical protein
MSFTLQAGITDPRVYPVDIDKMEGRTLAVRIKWQFKWKNASVNQVHEGKEFIADIKSRFPSSQVIINSPYQIYFSIN